MQITVTFDSLEEFNKCVNAKEPQPISKPAEAPKEPEKAPEVTEEPEKAPEVTEDFRVKVRKTLAELNKKSGKNIASELIKGFGFEKLTDVALSDLPALMNKAEEALNAI